MYLARKETYSWLSSSIPWCVVRVLTSPLPLGSFKMPLPSSGPFCWTWHCLWWRTRQRSLRYVRSQRSHWSDEGECLMCDSFRPNSSWEYVVNTSWDCPWKSREKNSPRYDIPTHIIHVLSLLNFFALSLSLSVVVRPTWSSRRDSVRWVDHSISHLVKLSLWLP